MGTTVDRYAPFAWSKGKELAAIQELPKKGLVETQTYRIFAEGPGWIGICCNDQL